MKYVKYLIMMFAAAAISAGCNSDIEKAQISPEGEVKAPVLSPLNDIVVNSFTSSETVTFTCTPVDFGQPVEIKYEIYLTNGETDARLVSGANPVLSVLKSDINGVAINQLGVAANETNAVSAYAVAYVGASTIATPKSNYVTFSVTTYKAPLRVYYICGVFNGWDAGAAPAMYETGAGTNVYEGMFNLTQDATNTPGQSGFKVLPVQAWNGDMGFSAFSSVSDNIVSSSDGNLLVDEGTYILSVDIGAMSVTATEVPHLVIIGGWDGWSTPIDMSYDPSTNVWTSTKAVSGDCEYLFRLDDGWAVKYGNGSKMAENIPEGETEAYELVKGGDNIVMPAGNWIVKLYADRTPWVVAYEAE